MPLSYKYALACLVFTISTILPAPLIPLHVHIILTPELTTAFKCFVCFVFVEKWSSFTLQHVSLTVTIFCTFDRYNILYCWWPSRWKWSPMMCCNRGSTTWYSAPWLSISSQLSCCWGEMLWTYLQHCQWWWLPSLKELFANWLHMHCTQTKHTHWTFF